MDEYLEMTIQFSLLILFGLAFPLCFTIAFVWDVTEFHTDKIKLINDVQRPVPISDDSIGPWMEILELVTYIGILSNSAWITYTAVRLGSWFPLGPLALFLLTLLTNFIV